MTCKLCNTAKLRSDNTSGMCRKCWQSAAGQRARYTPRKKRTGLDILREWVQRGQKIGHRFAPVVPDTEPNSWLTWCHECDGWLVYDAAEQSSPFGSRHCVDVQKCPGHVARAAERRSEYDLETRSTAVSNEPVEGKDTGYTSGYNWINDEASP